MKFMFTGMQIFDEDGNRVLVGHDICSPVHIWIIPKTIACVNQKIITNC
jgi:hypothetical protein